MRYAYGMGAAGALALLVAAVPVKAYDSHGLGPPPATWVAPGALHDYGPGYAVLRPWYLDPQFGTRRYYRSYEPHQRPMPVYIEPNYRLQGGFPHAYPMTGYIFPYPRARYGYPHPPPPPAYPPPAYAPPPTYAPPPGYLPPLK